MIHNSLAYSRLKKKKKEKKEFRIKKLHIKYTMEYK